MGDSGKSKHTNEIKTAAPLLDVIDIQGKTITADALLTQRSFADYLVQERKAHYHFTAKGNQVTLLNDIKLFFEGCWNYQIQKSSISCSKNAAIKPKRTPGF